MPARSPEEICHLFQRYMAEGDLESLLGVYDPQVVFLSRSGELRKGKQRLREELEPFIASKARFHFKINQVIQNGDIALMHTEWEISAPQKMSVYAIEVARRQADGSWCWLIGDPFTVGKHTAREFKAA